MRYPTLKTIDLTILLRRHKKKTFAKYEELRLAERVDTFATRIIVEDRVFNPEYSKLFGPLTPGKIILTREISKAIGKVLLHELCLNKREFKLASAINTRLTTAKTAEFFATQNAFDRQLFSEALTIGIKVAKERKDQSLEASLVKALNQVKAASADRGVLNQKNSEDFRTVFDRVGRWQNVALYNLMGEERSTLFNALDSLFANRVKQRVSKMRQQLRPGLN